MDKNRKISQMTDQEIDSAFQELFIANKMTWKNAHMKKIIKPIDHLNPLAIAKVINDSGKLYFYHSFEYTYASFINQLRVTYNNSAGDSAYIEIYKYYNNEWEFQEKEDCF